MKLLNTSTVSTGASNNNGVSVQPIQVIVRCRPPNQNEKSGNLVVKTSSIRKEVQVQQKLYSTGKQITKTFSFDHVYEPRASQQELFETSIKDIVNEALLGYNCTIFAYGQTSTGKTYTMEGNGDSPQHAGLISRAIQHIFHTLEYGKNEYTVKVSCLELYNEELQDLLCDDILALEQQQQQQQQQQQKETSFVQSTPSKHHTKSNLYHQQQQQQQQQQNTLRIFDEMAGGRKITVVHGLEEIVVQDARQIKQILERASMRRQNAETQLNKSSSRSHVITTVTIHMREQTADGEEMIKTGKLNLVDLAGSENVGRSGAVNKRAKEAGMINQSLLTLGRVITALCNRQPHVPYRESKLTRLLQDSLGGKTKTCIIATISPSAFCLDETLSTLDYAHRAKNIQNKPEINMKISKGLLIKEMVNDIEKLKAELQAQREKNGVFLTHQAFLEQQSTIEKQTQKIDSLKQEMEDLLNEIQQCRSDIAEYKSSLEKEKEEHEACKKHSQDLQSELDKEKSLHSSTKQELQRQFQKLQQEITNHHSTRQELQCTKSELEKERKDHKETKQKLDETTSMLQREVSDHKKTKKLLKKRCNELSKTQELVNSYCSEQELDLAHKKQVMEQLLKQQWEHQNEMKKQILQHLTAEINRQQLSHLSTFDQISRQVFSKLDSSDKRLKSLKRKTYETTVHHSLEDPNFDDKENQFHANLNRNQSPISGAVDEGNMLGMKKRKTQHKHSAL